MISSAGIEQLKQARDYISAKLGIYFPTTRLAELDNKLKELSKSGMFTSQHGFTSMLLGGKLSTDHMHALVQTLTIGETYFFRESATIEALGEEIMPAVSKQRGRVLRIWCAGCATGEEPYSIAMYLAEQSDLAGWRTSLIATDINPSFLERARKGEYTRWSFRTLPDHYKNSYFNSIADNLYEVKEAIRRKVKFFSLNLAEADYPSSSNATEGLDVIYCRNVLMYFSPDTIQTIIDRFAGALAPNGYLIVSQTECSDYFTAAFDTVQCGGSFFYRKKDSRSPVVQKIIPITKKRQHETPKATVNPIQTGAIKPRHVVMQPTTSDAREKSVEHILKQASTGDNLFAKAEKLANQGLLHDACSLCEEGLQCDGLNLHGYYLHATILQVAGKLPEAAGALRKALYLEPDFVMGNYTLGTIEQKLGNSRQALRSFDNTAKLLTLYKDEDLLPESEGISAGHMKELLTIMRKKNMAE
ncbi:MAG: CheR family methyltransferase [Desulfuromonadales bacterium]